MIEECRKCGKELDTDDCWGGEIECLFCGAVHDSSFDTVCGLIIEGVLE